MAESDQVFSCIACITDAMCIYRKELIIYTWFLVIVNVNIFLHETDNF